MPEPKKIVLGVCGGIAAYKSAELVRHLQRAGHEVRVVMTSGARQFIQPITFSSLTAHRVYTDLWAESPTADGATAIDHIALGQWADLLVIAPATANTLARLAHGLADDFLSALYLATTVPTLVVPAMNVNMWQHPATQANLLTLRQRGHALLTPDDGYLACGMTGPGRFPDPEAITSAIAAALSRPTQDLAGQTVLITAGGTREPIDAVRFLGNHSSGKMGYALATAAQSRGARVVLVSAPTALTPPPGVELVPVNTAAEMHAVVLTHLPQSTLLIAAAAVADFHLPAASTAAKLERNGPLTLMLEPTQDIVADAVAHRPPGTRILAFAAESGLDLERARAKLLRKGADAIVVNDITAPGLGFGSDRNAATLLTATATIPLGEHPKLTLAHLILDELSRL
jgi:phosphopantothenoylcysteine decarboxylase/phosphopantothenate--cysteine ligase